MTLPLLTRAQSKQIQTAQAHEVWRPLYFLNLYRMTLAALFVTTAFVPGNLPILGSHNAQGFLLTSITYLLVSMFSSFAIHWRKPSFNTLVQALAFLDIAALTLIMHTSGGIGSGLGMLLIVAIAGNSLLTAGRMANLFAAMAAISLLAEQVYSQLEGVLDQRYTQAGILGLTLFATAILSYVLSKRLRETEALAEQRGIDLANMAEINEHVVKRIQSGIVVVDADNRIRLMNESAWFMLGMPAVKTPGKTDLSSVSQTLQQQLNAWRNNEASESTIFRSNPTSIDLLPSFTRLGGDAHSGTVIYLEDTERTAKQAQQMKLASLGRLTASIAHEVRNPLGAIGHAEQLLAESPNLNTSDKRLIEIIHNHTQRVNGIIENVLQLSRRSQALPEEISLSPWLEKFIHEFLMSQGAPAEAIEWSIDPPDTVIYMDNTQLHQVLWNLCHNGLRFSKDYSQNPKVELRGGINADTQRPFLDIYDHGSGIDPRHIQNIFEPFFTTDSQGTGLGLYIAKELCQINNTHLSYIPVPSGGCCFRIEFASSKGQ